mmetsp:Transcript_45797/g.33523  ORF Transcript_45797/g.33523 Transcript_45797/m.33523 type:complete len:324 (+) Transcript_45797:331-1302(+)
MEVNPPIFNHDFLKELGESFSRRSFLKWERIMHSHGATLLDVFVLRYGKFERFADVVIYPENDEHVENVLRLAGKHKVCVIPYGGGTNVTNSLQLSPKETRMIVSLDMTRMNKIKWVDRENNMACVQAGIYGRDLEAELGKMGYCTGHEPDSMEFSTLGGWVSTRASGMMKNYYGNIEDLVLNVKFITPKGTFTKNGNWPRISNGPDLNHVVMGSEGNYGVVTEAIMKVKPLPPVKRYGSVVFPDFEKGIQFMAEVGKSGIWPASCRLMDNVQFLFGQSLKTEEGSKLKKAIDEIKKFYVTKIKGFDVTKIAALTLVFVGTEE